MFKSKINLMLIMAVIFSFVACGENSKKNTPKKEDVTINQADKSTSKEAKKDTIHLSIEANDQMQFNKKVLKVAPNQVVVLTLKHVGKMPKETMGHNLVILNKGVDASKFTQEAVNAKDTEYIPASAKDDIMAHTKLLGGGEEDTITFKAPETAGTYDFLCSFPGHIAMMKGKFVVK